VLKVEILHEVNSKIILKWDRKGIFQWLCDSFKREVMGCVKDDFHIFQDVLYELNDMLFSIDK